MIKTHFDMLGCLARDRISGLEGVITSLSFDLYGCIQVIITPQGVKDDGELKKGCWFDTNRVVILDDQKVMDPPDFLGRKREPHPALGESGPAEKPVK